MPCSIRGNTIVKPVLIKAILEQMSFLIPSYLSPRGRRSVTVLVNLNLSGNLPQTNLSMLLDLMYISGCCLILSGKEHLRTMITGFISAFNQIWHILEHSNTFRVQTHNFLLVISQHYY
jgi:hypothetical protein